MNTTFKKIILLLLLILPALGFAQNEVSNVPKTTYINEVQTNNDGAVRSIRTYKQTAGSSTRTLVKIIEFSYKDVVSEQDKKKGDVILESYIGKHQSVNMKIKSVEGALVSIVNKTADLHLLDRAAFKHTYPVSHENGSFAEGRLNNNAKMSTSAMGTADDKLVITDIVYSTDDPAKKQTVTRFEYDLSYPSNAQLVVNLDVNRELYDNDGNVSHSENFKSNTRVPIRQEPAGIMITEIPNINNSEPTEQSTTYPDGKIKTTGSFHNGKPIGIHKTYNPDGSLKSETTYRSDEGTYTIIDQLNNQPLNGQKAKERIRIFLQGKVKTDIIYNDQDVPIIETTHEYNSDGKIEHTETKTMYKGEHENPDMQDVQKIVYNYDGYGLLSTSNETSEATVIGSGEVIKSHIETSYDTNGNVERTTISHDHNGNQSKSVSDPMNGLFLYGHAIKELIKNYVGGKIISENIFYYYADTNPSVGIVTKDYKYDANGRLVSTETADNGNITETATYLYTDSGLLSAVEFRDGKKVTSRIAYKYELVVGGNGRLIITELTYNKDGVQVSEGKRVAYIGNEKGNNEVNETTIRLINKLPFEKVSDSYKGGDANKAEITNLNKEEERSQTGSKDKEYQNTFPRIDPQIYLNETNYKPITVGNQNLKNQNGDEYFHDGTIVQTFESKNPNKGSNYVHESSVVNKPVVINQVKTAKVDSHHEWNSTKKGDNSYLNSSLEEIWEMLQHASPTQNKVALLGSDGHDGLLEAAIQHVSDQQTALKKPVLCRQILTSVQLLMSTLSEQKDISVNEMSILKNLTPEFKVANSFVSQAEVRRGGDAKRESKIEFLKSKNVDVKKHEDINDINRKVLTAALSSKLDSKPECDAVFAAVFKTDVIKTMLYDLEHNTSNFNVAKTMALQGLISKFEGKKLSYDDYYTKEFAYNSYFKEGSPDYSKLHKAFEHAQELYLNAKSEDKKDIDKYKEDARTFKEFKL